MAKVWNGVLAVEIQMTNYFKAKKKSIWQYVINIKTLMVPYQVHFPPMFKIRNIIYLC